VAPLHPKNFWDRLGLREGFPSRVCLHESIWTCVRHTLANNATFGVFACENSRWREPRGGIHPGGVDPQEFQKRRLELLCTLTSRLLLCVSCTWLACSTHRKHCRQTGLARVPQKACVVLGAATAQAAKFKKKNRT